MTDNLRTKAREAREIAEKATPNVYASIYEDHPQGSVRMIFKNPWHGVEEVMCMLMWPAHPFEATEQVEQWYESSAKLWAASHTLVPELAELLEQAAIEIDKQAFYQREACDAIRERDNQIDLLNTIRESQGNMIARQRKAIKYVKENLYKMAAPYAEETYAEIEKVLKGE